MRGGVADETGPVVSGEDVEEEQWLVHGHHDGRAALAAQSAGRVIRRLIDVSADRRTRTWVMMGR
jgi:hypothetical protein